MSSAAQEIADLPDGGLLWEPRSFWDVFPVALLADEPQLIHLDREKFFNGSRYPITLDRVAVCGINYLYAQNPTPPVPNITWQSAVSVLQGVEITVTAPFRQHYGVNPIRLNTLAPIPTGQPEAPLVPGTTFRSSSLFGVGALNFNKPYFLPRLGSIHWDISSAYAPTIGTDIDARITALFQEQGGNFAGNARSFQFAAQQLSSVGLAPNGELIVNQESWPYSIDAFFDGGAPGDTGDFWPPQSAFNTKLFDEQEATRSGTTLLDGLRVHIDQINQDDSIADDVGSDNAQAAEMVTRFGSRIRTTNAGTNEWWWREGAPLCLTLDSITPATVYKLPYPITLGPGDTLDVELAIPAAPADAILGLPIQQQINTGISFNGWAAIED